MIAFCLILAAAVAGLAWDRYRNSTRGLLADRVRRRVLVTLKTGETFSGVLLAADRDALVLVEATAVAYGPGSSDVPVSGEALILRADVAYVQVVG